MNTNIQSLPSRYEPLIDLFGDEAQTTFIRQEDDLQSIARLIQQSNSANQGKLQFIYSKQESGSGKTTFVQSLDIFLPDLVEDIQRIPNTGGDVLKSIIETINQLSPVGKKHIVNLDGHESSAFSDEQYKTFLVQLNSILRNRKDIIILWPTNDLSFAEKIVKILHNIGGNSPFGTQKIYHMIGLPPEKYRNVLESILKVANWKIEDAALDDDSVEKITDGAVNIGDYLDKLQSAIAEKFDIGKVGFIPPQLVFALTSSLPNLREVCRSVRRADSYYIESSRLLMYTKRSNVAEWWIERGKELKTALPYIVSLFNARLTSLSASAVVHAVQNFGIPDLNILVTGVQKNLGNAKTTIKSTELYRFSMNEDLDNTEYGKPTKKDTIDSYNKIQEESKKKHKEINMAIMTLLKEVDSGFTNIDYEKSQGLSNGLLVDVTCGFKGENCCIELSVTFFMFS